MKRRSLSTMARLRVFESTGTRCHICGERIQAGQPWEVEHVIPLALGGNDNEANMAPAHKACHAEKTPVDVGRIAKAKRQRAAHIGAKQRGWQSKWKRKLNGEVVLR